MLAHYCAPWLGDVSPLSMDSAGGRSTLMRMMMRPIFLLLVAGIAGAADTAPAGYLGTKASDLAGVVGPPPAPGSATELADRAAYRAALDGVGSPEWTRAVADRVERLPDMLRRMHCAIGRDLTPDKSPHLFVLLSRAQADLSVPLRVLKQRYDRPRPFVDDDVSAPVCDVVPPELRKQGRSYPSGHAAQSALNGYVLASLFSDRAVPIVRRSIQYGDERVVCRVHFPSDVRAAQTLAAAVFARLWDNQTFRRDWARAKREAALLPTIGTCTD